MRISPITAYSACPVSIVKSQTSNIVRPNFYGYNELYKEYTKNFENLYSKLLNEESGIVDVFGSIMRIVRDFPRSCRSDLSCIITCCRYGGSMQLLLAALNHNKVEPAYRALIREQTKLPDGEYIDVITTPQGERCITLIHQASFFEPMQSLRSLFSDRPHEHYDFQLIFRNPENGKDITVALEKDDMPYIEVKDRKLFYDRNLDNVIWCKETEVDSCPWGGTLF